MCWAQRRGTCVRLRGEVHALGSEERYMCWAQRRGTCVRLRGEAHALGSEERGSYHKSTNLYKEENRAIKCTVCQLHNLC